jgi:hypothetical protein
VAPSMAMSHLFSMTFGEFGLFSLLKPLFSKTRIIVGHCFKKEEACLKS